jgi:hypothetical protein
MRVLAPLLASWRRHWRPFAVLLLCAVAALAQAQSSDGGAAPPDRAARLSYLSGNLGLLPAGSQSWADADINRPLTTGDKLATGNGARAELELGGGVLRMAGNTDFGLLNLNDNLAQVELTRGTLNLSVRHLDQGQSYEIDTPTLALVVTRPGSYRVDVDGDGQGTRVSVLDGQATVYGENNASHDVFAGRSYQFNDPGLGALMITDLGAGDGFDAWCSQRDRRYAQSVTRRYVSDDVVGYQDLDEYGRWQTSSEYGAVWYPSAMPADWAPYRTGHWAWIAPWGWTWVDDAPWGFAPYHYGRWAFIGGAWGWIPGPIVVRPVYAPALVAFVGGGGWSVSIGGGPVGWFPLGPGEIYNPWYHCDRHYYQRVNITNIYVHNTYNRTTVINNIDRHYADYRNGRVPTDHRWANRTAPRGFTAVPGHAFADGKHVQRDLLRVNPHDIAAAPVLAHGVSTLRPTPRAIAPLRGEQARPLPTADFRRNVVARTPPPAALPMARPADETAPRPAARAQAPFGNVRVLNPRGGPRAADNREPARERPMLDRSNPPRGNLPPTSNLPAGVPIVRQPEPLPPGALPSSGYAHPHGEPRSLPGTAPVRRVDEPAPRPGVDNLRSPVAPPQPRSAGNLPQPPRFERAPAEAPQDRREPVYQPPRYAPPRPVEQPAREPSYQPPRNEPPREPSYPPPRQEPPRQSYQPPREPVYQPPRFEPPRPSFPPPREAPRPAEPAQHHAEPARREPPRKDDQQH